MIEASPLAWFGAIEPMSLAIFVGASIFLLLIYFIFLEAGAGEGRIRRSMIERHQARLKSESMRRDRVSGNDKTHRRLGVMMSLVALLPNDLIGRSQKQLRSAGFSENSAILLFWLAKCFFCVLTICFGLLLFFNPFGAALDKNLLIGLCIVNATGIIVPDVYVNLKRKNRLRNIERGLPDGLDLLVICAEAGLSLDAGLKRVADEFVTVVPELSEELLLTSVELNFLPDRRQALANLAQRADVPAFRGVTATLIQTEKYGTPLAQALRTLAAEFRESRLLKAEEKAARLPAILTVPMILFILPALFIVLAAPAFIKVAEKVSN